MSKMTEHGVSTTKEPGEQYEFFTANGKKRVQYDFRSENGELFSCVAKNLKEAREKRDSWLDNQEQSNQRMMP